MLNVYLSNTPTLMSRYLSSGQDNAKYVTNNLKCSFQKDKFKMLKFGIMKNHVWIIVLNKKSFHNLIYSLGL